MAEGVVYKDPAASVNFSLDWAEHLAKLGGGLTLAASTWTTPSGITQVLGEESFTDTVATARWSGGTDGLAYEVINDVTYSDGQTDQKSLIIVVRHAEAGSSSDATDRANALTVLRDLAQETAAPTLTSTEVEAILDRSKYASTWIANKAYSVGDRVVPVTRNGHYYICIQPGTSQTAAKIFTDWPTTYGQHSSEGSSDPILMWEEAGPDIFNPGIAGYERNVYDLGQAARDCWLLKARKSTQAIDDGDVSFSQWREHCLDEAKRFYPKWRSAFIARS